MERQYANYLIDVFRDMVVAVADDQQLHMPQNVIPEGINTNIPNIIPNNQFLNINHNLPIHGLINYIENTDPLNPDDDQW